MTTTSDWSEDQPDGQTGNERAGRCTSASDRKCPPPQSMSQHSTATGQPNIRKGVEKKML